MKNKAFNLALAIVILCAGFSVVGCSGLSGTGSDNQQKTPIEQARDYVSILDSCAADLSSKYDELVEAYTKDDTIAARLKIEELKDILDKAANLEVPPALKEEGTKYQSACNDLKDALFSLEEASKTSKSGQNVDSLISDASSKYESAVQTLKDADAAIQSKLEKLK